MEGRCNGFAKKYCEMYIDREFDEYPYFCEFYDMVIDDAQMLYDQTESKVIVHSTECDIQESGHGKSGDYIKSDHTVYLPYVDEEQVYKIKNGLLFEGYMGGFTINGKVVGVFPSQLCGIKVYIQDTTA